MNKLYFHAFLKLMPIANQLFPFSVPSLCIAKSSRSEKIRKIHVWSYMCLKDAWLVTGRRRYLSSTLVISCELIWIHIKDSFDLMPKWWLEVTAFEGRCRIYPPPPPQMEEGLFGIGALGKSWDADNMYMLKQFKASWESTMMTCDCHLHFALNLYLALVQHWICFTRYTLMLNC